MPVFPPGKESGIRLARRWAGPRRVFGIAGNRA